MRFTERMKKAVAYLASTELAVVLLLVISLVAIPGTISDNRSIYTSPLFLSLLALFGMNLVLCTLRRFATISRPVLILHGGVIVTLAGCIISSFGFVATVNLYEGTIADRVYRWDLQKDVPLPAGVGLVVSKINWDYYPMPVRIGVLKGEIKENLFELKTGDRFNLHGYQVLVGPPEPGSDNLKLSVFDNTRLLGIYNTLSGMTDLPADFPYTFRLVASIPPMVRRQWVDLMLVGPSGKVAAGTSEVNGPFQWNGLYFFNTQIAQDAKGVQYAGIQIVRDPGRWVVFLGMSIVALGAILATFRRWYGAR